MITWNEVREFGAKWFDTASDGSAAEQAAFFLDPNSRIHVVSTGATFDFDTHAKLHTQWINERHIFADFALTQLSASPERVRAVGTVYWQAEYPGRPPPNVVKAIVGEDWIIERTPSGALKFVLYMNTFHHLLPDSAPLAI